MPDFRGIPLNYAGRYTIQVALETTEPNMTIGNIYEVFAVAVDNAATPPHPYALVFDDNNHFKLVDLSKVRRAPST